MIYAHEIREQRDRNRGQDARGQEPSSSLSLSAPGLVSAARRILLSRPFASIAPLYLLSQNETSHSLVKFIAVPSEKELPSGKL